ncbi:hypothetical protein QR680_013470 [Steinernema hermaphroditum]|uniref:Strawberry notch AAA domain-containing protein n=1 Tax=Steinernema hermaphroditum TaxID=289476 RepID=A0AA39I7X9_9BILA|nr:hypothetical protein QR680_013470 [Steinernema hermaphroditum]
MDDLLSAAIEEAGLTEYLSEPNSPAPPSTEAHVFPATTAVPQEFPQEVAQQPQFVASTANGSSYGTTIEDGTNYGMSNGDANGYGYQQPVDIQFMENGQMDFGFGSSLTSSASAPVIDDPTNELNYFFSDLPASFMNASSSQAQPQPDYSEPIAPIDTSSSLDASSSSHYVTPTFNLDSPSSSAFSSPSENSDPATLSQPVRVQNTPSPVIRTPAAAPMNGKVVSQAQPPSGQKMATKAKLVTTAKGQKYLVDKDGRKIDTFTKVVRANGEVVSTSSGQIQSRTTNGTPAVIRPVGAEGQPRIISTNQKMIYVMRETEDGQQQSTPARFVRLPDGRLVARPVNSRPGSPVVVSVNGGQGGLLVRRRMSTPNLVSLEAQGPARKVSINSIRNSPNPSTPYVSIDGEHMIVTPPESSANSPVPGNETKYVPVGTPGARQQFIRTSTSGGRQLVVSRPGATAAVTTVKYYRQPDGTLVQQRQIVQRPVQGQQRVPGQYSGRYDAARIRSGGTPIRRGPPLNAGENHEQMMEAAAAAATAPLSPQLPTSRMLQMGHLNPVDQRFVRVRPDQMDQRGGNRPPPLPMPGTIKRTTSMISMQNGGRPNDVPGSAPPFDPVKAAKKKAAGDEMRAALQAGAEFTERNQEFDTEEENLGHAETYAEYVPSKLRSGLSHPDCVVETASLSSVQPPDVRYQIRFPEELIDTGCISALQLEAVIYACQMHQNCLPSGERCGYLIGDGAGVGKGRTIACIIYENYLLGRKRAIWLSVSSDLRYDSERDFRDIGAGGINVYQLNKLKYAKISGKENGGIKKGVMFATYSSLIGECRTAKSKYRSRLKQLVQWCGGPDFDGVIVFDECHRAKNLCPSAGSKPTKTGRMVLELQKELPNARVVYASATGASEPRNMAYMTRLGLWGSGQSFPEFGDFINAVERRGVGAMEVVAMDMKQRGMYLARQLSFRGVSFRVQEVPLSDEFIRVYDDSVKLWLECRRQFQNALAQMSEDRRSAHKMIWGQFWAAHQRFFKYLCIAAKVEACVRITRESIKQNKCVVIGLQSTGEARTLEQLEDCGGELTEFVSTAKHVAVLQGLVEKHFPTGSGRSRGIGDALDDMDRMFGGFGESDNRKRKRNELLEDFGISPQAKRRQAKNESDEDGDDNNDSDTSDSDDSDDDISLGDDEEAWINTLMQEAESSSSEDESSDEESENDGNSDSVDSDNSDKEMEMEKAEESPAEDEFNPFTTDFTSHDPWENRQRVVADSPEKKMKEKEVLAEKKRLKRQRRIDREKKRKQLRKEAKKRKRDQIAESLKRTTAMESEAMKHSANDFIKSSRIIDNGFTNGFGFASTNDLTIIKAELLTAIEKLGKSLPANTLDHLIDELGGPQFVAELTGRKGRVVTKEDGEVGYELRSANADVALEKMNLEEKDLFMKGEKKIAIISEAASSGISLQSDRRAENQLRRVHITLELPWSADKAIQQFGRTHRSNQVSAPEYLFLISELAGEKRFASIVAKRLESLGALTHGDRRATETRDLSQFNLDTKYGRSALDVLCRSVIGSLNPPLIEPPADYMPGNFFQDMRHYMEGVGLLNRVDKDVYSIEREAANISKFLNRILGLPVHAQNALFQYFLDVLKALVDQARYDGTYDLGIMDLGTAGDVVRKMETRVFVGHAQKGSFRVEMHKVAVERGVSWEQAMDLYKDHNIEEDGFYLSRKGAAGKRAAALIYGIGKLGMEKGIRMYAVTRPSTGRSAKLEAIADIKKRFQKALPEEAEQAWKDQYENAASACQHVFFHGKCKMASQGQYCEVGRRTRTYFILSGAVLSVWPIVEEVLCGGNIRDSARKSARMQVIRVRTEENQKIVGLLVIATHVRALVGRLEEHCSKSYLDVQKSKK